MDGKTIDLLNQRIDDLKEENNRRFDEGNEQFKKINEKLDYLIKWKWQIGSAAVVIGLIAAFFAKLGEIGLEHALK